MKNSAKGLKIFSIFALSIFVLLLIFAVFSADHDKNSVSQSTSLSTSTTKVVTKKKKTVKVKAVNLIKEFEKNPTAADEKYRDKILEIFDCKIVNFDNSSVELGYFSDELFDFSFGEIKGYYNKAQHKKAQSLKKDDAVTVSGEYNGLTNSNNIKLVNTKFL